MNQKLKQGEVWLAKVFFKNEERYKHRPVVVVGHEITIDIIISHITSSSPRNDFDIIINYWKEVGLKHLSVARTTKISAIPQSSLVKKLGNLHPYDLHKILNKCRELF